MRLMPVSGFAAVLVCLAVASGAEGAGLALNRAVVTCTETAEIADAATYAFAKWKGAIQGASGRYQSNWCVEGADDCSVAADFLCRWHYPNEEAAQVDLQSLGVNLKQCNDVSRFSDHRADRITFFVTNHQSDVVAFRLSKARHDQGYGYLLELRAYLTQ